MFFVEKKGFSAARRDLCRSWSRDPIAVGEEPRPLMVLWPFSRRCPGPAKMASMKVGSLMWTSVGVILIIGPRVEVRGEERVRRKREGKMTVFFVHFFYFPDVLSATNGVVVESVKVCCSYEGEIRLALYECRMKELRTWALDNFPSMSEGVRRVNDVPASFRPGIWDSGLKYRR